MIKEESKEFQEIILKDKMYFINMILEMEQKYPDSIRFISGSEHKAEHKNGITNIAIYNAKNDFITQYNNVSDKNPKGTSVLTYKVHSK